MIASGIRENGGLDAACPAAKLQIEPHVVSYHFNSMAHAAIPEIQ